MSSLVLSKNSLKRVFGERLHGEDIIQTQCQRPKTAVPGRRRPLTEKPPKSEESPTVDNKTINRALTERPKTSYSDRPLQSNRKEHVTKLHNVDHFAKHSHKQLEEFDIVEYFNDKTIRDIFPLHETDLDQRVHNKHHANAYTKKANPQFNTERLQRPKINEIKSLDQKSKLTIKPPHDSSNHTNEMFEFLTEDLYAIDRKSNSFMDKSSRERDIRQRLHSDTDIISSNYRISSFTKSSNNRKPLSNKHNRDTFPIGQDQQFYSSKTDRLLAKYSPDVHPFGSNMQSYVNRNGQKCGYYSGNTNNLPNRTIHIPRKLKPISKVTDE